MSVGDDNFRVDEIALLRSIADLRIYDEIPGYNYLIRSLCSFVAAFAENLADVGAEERAMREAFITPIVRNILNDV